jgi:hypothetical protein
MEIRPHATPIELVQPQGRAVKEPLLPISTVGTGNTKKEKMEP